MRKILIRLDDICPTMDFNQFERADRLLRKYEVKPLLGVIPDCRDPELIIDDFHEDFWEYIKKLQKEGYAIAMHGYQHVYDIQCRGMVNKSWKSEFAGHSYEEQLRKIRKGKEIFSSHGVDTDIFFAPAHSYDRNTLKALDACGFKYVSDGMSLHPVKRYGIVCIPCRSPGVPRIKKNGYYTVVFHTHEWTRPDKESAYNMLKDICCNYSNDIVNFNLYNDREIRASMVWKVDEYIYVRYWRYLKPILSKIKRVILRRIKTVQVEYRNDCKNNCK